MLVGSSLTLSCMAMLVRFTRETQGLGIYAVAFVRFLVCAVTVLAVARAGRIPLRTRSLKWLVLRGVFGATAVTIYYHSITHIGLAKATILMHTFPLWAALFARLFLKERPRPLLLAAAAVALGGLYLVIVPPDGLSAVSAGDLVPLGGAVLGGMAIVAVRRLRATDSSFVILLSQCTFGLVLLALPFAADLPAPPAWGWGLLAAIGLTAAAGQLTLTYSYRHVGVTEAAPFNMLVPVWNTVLAVLVFNETLTASGFAGGILVVASCSYAAGSGPAVRAREGPVTGGDHGDPPRPPAAGP
jgi:drug/metabolite transporter (DMT)-like permease